MKFHQVFVQVYQIAAKRMCKECQDFIKQGSQILDIGCDSGIIIKTFGEHFKAEVIGVDIEDNRTLPITFKLIQGDNLAFPDNSFDVVLIAYVLHHTKNPFKILQEAKRVSRNKIIIYEDSPEGFLAKLRCWFHQTTYNLFFQDTNQKYNFKTEKEWQKVFDEIGLNIVKSKKASVILDWLDPVKRNIFVLEK